MANFAVLSNNLVSNIIISDSVEDAEAATNSTCVGYDPTSQSVGIGWTYDPSNGTFSAPIIPITITFDGNHATGGNMLPQTMNPNTSTALSQNLFSYTGYTFSGWDTSMAGATVVYNDQEDVSLSSDTSLYAVWTVVS